MSFFSLLYNFYDINSSYPIVSNNELIGRVNTAFDFKGKNIDFKKICAREQVILEKSIGESIQSEGFVEVNTCIVESIYTEGVIICRNSEFRLFLEGSMIELTNCRAAEVVAPFVRLHNCTVLGNVAAGYHLEVINSVVHGTLQINGKSVTLDEKGTYSPHPKQHRAIALHSNLSHPDEIKRLFEETKLEYGKLDVRKG